MRFHKPIGIFLLLWPTLWALWVAAHGFPSMKNLIIFVLGVIFMRAAGCVINDFADRHFDSHVKRTQHRPITTGDISIHSALILFLILCLLAFGLVLLTNPLTIFLAIAAVIVTTIYPFMKRYTHFPQVVLGIAFSFSVPMAFAAQINQLNLMTWVLMLATILWTIAYDTQYAIVDREDDIKIGIKSTAVFFRQYTQWIIGLLQLFVVILLLFVGYHNNLSHNYFISIFIAFLLFFYQHLLMKSRNPKHYFHAFLNNHWVGLVVFLGLCLK